MAVVVDENDVLIALGVVNEILKSDVYYNNGVAIIQSSNYSIIEKEGLKNICEGDGDFHDTMYLLFMYENYSILYDHTQSFKINYAFDKSLYSKSYNPKITLTRYRIIFVEEKTNRLIVLHRDNRIIKCFDLPDYKLFLGIKAYDEVKYMKIHYITHDNMFVSERFEDWGMFERTKKYYAIMEKPNFQYVKGYLIKNDTVYKIDRYVFNKIIDRLVDVIGNVIYLLDDNKYYYYGDKSLKELDLDLYLPYIENQMQIKSARKS